MNTRPSTLLHSSSRIARLVLAPVSRVRGVVTSGLVLGALCLGAGACTVTTREEAHARVYDYDATPVQAAPVNVETYPTVEYRGSPAYLVDGRWYYRHQNRWVYFNREPEELQRYRTNYRVQPRPEPRENDRYRTRLDSKFQQTNTAR